MVQPGEIKSKLEVEGLKKKEKPEKINVGLEQGPGFEQSEKLVEKKIEDLNQEADSTEETTNLNGATASDIAAQDHLAAREKQVEKILEAGFEKIYSELTPEKKLEFKTLGEKTAQQINLLLSGTKVKLKKVVQLIVKWLKVIPGVNSFFLEQEAKIRADEIIKLKE